MEKALYGHIKLGRCVDEDLVGHLGCYTDQLSVMDRKCSGSNKCMVHFKESDMEGEFPCTLSKALARYLEADYKCQRGKFFTFLLPSNCIFNYRSWKPPK